MKRMSNHPKMSREPIDNGSMELLRPNFGHQVSFGEPLNENGSFTVSYRQNPEILPPGPGTSHASLDISDGPNSHPLERSIPHPCEASAEKRLKMRGRLVILLLHVTIPDFMNKICFIINRESCTLTFIKASILGTREGAELRLRILHHINSIVYLGPLEELSLPYGFDLLFFELVQFVLVIEETYLILVQ